MCRPVFFLVAALVKVPTCGRISVSLNTTSDPSYSCFFPPLSSNTTFLSFSFMCSDQYCPSFTIIFISNLVRTRARSFSRFFFLFQSMFMSITYSTSFFLSDHMYSNSKRGGMATHAGVALELGIIRPTTGGLKMMSPQMEAILIWCQCRVREYEVINRVQFWQNSISQIFFFHFIY